MPRAEAQSARSKPSAPSASRRELRRPPRSFERRLDQPARTRYIVGKNIIDLKDPTGAPITGSAARGGEVRQARFRRVPVEEDRRGHAEAEKCLYNIGACPNVQPDVTSGDFADDLDAALVESVVQALRGFSCRCFPRLPPRRLRRWRVAPLPCHPALSVRPCAAAGARDLEAGIDGCERGDEIGAMAKAVKVFEEDAAQAARAGGGGRTAAVRPSRSAAARPPRAGRSRAASGHVVWGTPGFLASSACPGEISSSKYR